MSTSWLLLATTLGTIVVAVEWRLLRSALLRPSAGWPPLRVLAAILCAYGGWYAIEAGRIQMEGALEVRGALAWPSVGYAIPHVWLLLRLLRFRYQQEGGAK